jgi:hypothetical protein
MTDGTRPDGVGNMRFQAAYCDGKTPVILVSDDPEVKALLRGLKVVRSYPDTTDSDGAWNSSFKIQVERLK